MITVRFRCIIDNLMPSENGGKDSCPLDRHDKMDLSVPTDSLWHKTAA